MFSRIPLLVSCVLLLLGCGVLAKEIPFEMENGLIWVKVDSKGKVFDFLLDTGAGATVLEQQTAKKLRLKFGEAKPLYGVGRQGVAYLISGFEGSLGGVPLARDVYGVSLRKPKGPKFRRMHGVIGQDFFRNRMVRIDFQKRVIEVLGKASPSRRGAVTLPLRYHGDAILVPVSVDGSQPEWTRLDTGCNSALEWGLSTETPRSGRRVIPAEVRLGAAAIRSVSVGFHPQPFFEGEAGLLGNGLLSRYRMTVDTRQMRLVLE